jgi:hypothetical protein
MNFRKYLRLLLAFCILPVALWAQVDTGSISGAVTDPKGALVPGAEVVATHVPTGRQYSSETTQAALYVFPNLPTGPYTLTIKQTGFKTFVRTGIEVRVGLRETIDIKLELGPLQQAVEVKATAPLFETANQTRGENLSPQMLTNLPLWNGSLRLANAFVPLMAGVNVWSETSINGSVGRASEVLIDGVSLVNPESGGVVFYFPGFEAYGEMKLLTSGFTAENGRVGGGIQEYVTKSGSNQVHGAAFFNWMRDTFDAVPWSVNQNAAARTCNGQTHAQACRPKQRYNEEGGTAGGPVYLPHLYDGRDKTFFFFTWTGFWQPATVTVNSGETTPTAAMVQGNFQGLYGATNPVIYDPATANGARQPFGSPSAYNIIPTSRFSTISKNILPYIPAPNVGSGLIGNYTFNSTSELTDKVWSIKIDHTLKTRNRLAFFYTHRNNQTNAVQYFPGPLSNGLNSLNSPRYVRVYEDFTINPHWLLHSFWGISQERSFNNNPLQNGFGTKFGFPLAASTPQDATPVIAFDSTLGGSAWGQTAGTVNMSGQWNWTTQAAETLTWVHGKHEFKMGWDIRRMRTTSDSWAGTNGQYDFLQSQTAVTSGSSITGNAFASFLLGAVAQGSQNALPVFIPRTRYGYHAGFFQDAWRIRPRLTINLGLRYEVPIGWHNVVGDYSSFSPTALDPTAGNLPGALIFMGTGPGRIGALRPYPTDFSDIGPRAGFAWRLSDTVVVRAAFGIFYEALGNGGCGCEDGFGGGSFAQTSDGYNPAFYWDPGAYNPNKLANNPGGVQPPVSFTPAQQIPGVDNFSGPLLYMGPHFGKAPRIYEMNFTLQKTYRSWLFEGAYVSNRAHGLASSESMNVLPTSLLYLTSAGPSGDTNLLAAGISDPNICTYSIVIPCTNGVPNLPFPTFGEWGSAATLAQALNPFPQYGAVFSANSGDGYTWYDAFQGKVEHRFGDLNFTATYVFSKTLDEMGYRQIFTQCCVEQAQDAYNLRDAKTFAYEDFPHFINIIESYYLPFGRGKKFFRNTQGLLDRLVGGWIVAGYGQYRSGGLIQVLSPNNFVGTYLHDILTKADYNGLPIRSGISSTSLDPNNPNVRWFNYGANIPFTQAPLGTLGNASIFNTHFRNPWYRYEAISANKEIRVRERVQFKYSVNIFNPFNRTDFGNITGTINSANFGRPTGAQVGARTLTMGLRLEF